MALQPNSHTGSGGGHNGTRGALVDNLILICVIAVVGAVFVVSVVVVCVLRKDTQITSTHGRGRVTSNAEEVA